MRIRPQLVVLALLGPGTAEAQPVQLVHAFEAPAASPRGGLVAMPDGSIYGTTAEGGAGGTIYRIAPGGGALTIVARFDRGRTPNGALVLGNDGFLYGTTFFGGVGDVGTVFRFDPATARIETLHAFVPSRDGTHPRGIVVTAAGLLYGTAHRYAFADPDLLVQLDPATGRTQAVAGFVPEGPRGSVPGDGLVQAPDGRLYGTMTAGGRTPSGGFGHGTVYRFDPATSEVTVVHVFDQADGWRPERGLTRTGDGWLYGTTFAGGAENAGTIYRIDPATGGFESIHHLQPSNGTDGGAPLSRLIEGADGALYGTTSAGTGTGGTIFRLRRLPGGGHAFATLMSIDPASVGAGLFADLALAPDGWIHGAADSGGPLDGGTVFRFDSLERGPSGNPLQFSVVHAFSKRGAGWSVDEPPVAGSDGALYGMTRQGGANGRGDIYRLDPVTGQTTVLAPVPGLGLGPSQGMSVSAFVDGGDGALYGTVTGGGTGQILRVVPATGAVTLALQVPLAFGSTGFAAGLVRAGPSVYGLVDTIDGIRTYRFDPVAATMTTGAVIAGAVADIALTGTPGGQVYVETTSILITGPASIRIENFLLRVDPAAATSQIVAGGSQRFASVEPSSAPDGTIYFVGARVLGPEVIDAYNPATGAIRDACVLPELRFPRALSVAPDGRLFVSVSIVDQQWELYVCSPGSTAATRVDPGAPDVRLLSRFTHVAGTGLLYAANSGGPLGGGSIVRMATAGALPIVDGDSDGLANDWETTFGLDPASAAADDGPSGDPDGDGATNAQEQAAGTHPRGFVTRFLAEGATNTFFQTRLALANPGLDPARVLVRFLTDAGLVVPHVLVVPGRARRTIEAGHLPGLASATFSMVVESDVAIAVDRTMTWDASGYGSHTESAAASPAQTWYLAEGSTSGDFELFYLLQNPGPAIVTATVRYLRPSGLPPIERQYALPAHSRTTIYVDRQGPELASTDVSAVIAAPSPISVERAMYRTRPGQPFAAGHASAGVTAAALEWFLAEGATGTFFDLFVLVANPNPTPAEISAEYLRLGGGVFTKTYTVPANGRFTIWVDDETIPAGSGQKPLADAALSTTIRSTNGVPVIVERTMWWPGPGLTPDYWYEAHNSPGATSSATRWIAAGGEVGGMEGTGADTYVLIANPTSTPARVRVRLLLESGNTTGRSYDLPPKSRTNVWLGNTPITGDFSGEIEGGRAAVLVESLGATPVPIVVERATYASPGGVVWAAGGNALAAPLP